MPICSLSLIVVSPDIWELRVIFLALKVSMDVTVRSTVDVRNMGVVIPWRVCVTVTLDGQKVRCQNWKSKFVYFPTQVAFYSETVHKGINFM